MQKPIEYLEQANPKGVKDVISSGSPTVAVLLKDTKGEAVCRAILVKLINNLNDFANVNKPMSASQVTDTVILLLEKHPSAKMPEDFILAFKRIKQGVYGTFYGGIDGMVIGNMVEQYFEDKRNEVVSLNLAKSKTHLEESKEPLKLPAGTVPPVSEWFKDKAPEIKPSKPLEMSPEQKLFNSFLKQFDWLYSMNPVEFDREGKTIRGKFIKRYGKIMGVQEFLNYKADQYFRVNEYLDSREAA